MKKSEFRNIIREEIRSVLNEEDTIIEKDRYGNHLEPQFQKEMK